MNAVKCFLEVHKIDVYSLLPFVTLFDDIAKYQYLLLVLVELFRSVLRLRCYERISLQNQRFCFSGSQLTQNVR